MHGFGEWYQRCEYNTISYTFNLPQIQTLTTPNTNNTIKAPPTRRTK
jgi:hypothetical protein